MQLLLYQIINSMNYRNNMHAAFNKTGTLRVLRIASEVSKIIWYHNTCIYLIAFWVKQNMLCGRQYKGFQFGGKQAQHLHRQGAGKGIISGLLPRHKRGNDSEITVSYIKDKRGGPVDDP